VLETGQGPAVHAPRFGSVGGIIGRWYLVFEVNRVFKTAVNVFANFPFVHRVVNVECGLCICW